MKTARRPRLNQDFKRLIQFANDLIRNRSLNRAVQAPVKPRIFHANPDSSSTTPAGNLNRCMKELHGNNPVIAGLDPAIHSAAPRVRRVGLDAIRTRLLPSSDTFNWRAGSNRLAVKPGHDRNSAGQP